MSSAALALKVQHIPLSVGLVLKMAVQFTWTETLIEYLLYSSPEQKLTLNICCTVHLYRIIQYIYCTVHLKRNILYINCTFHLNRNIHYIYCKVRLNKNSFFISVVQFTWTETFIIFSIQFTRTPERKLSLYELFGPQKHRLGLVNIHRYGKNYPDF